MRKPGIRQLLKKFSWLFALAAGLPFVIGAANNFRVSWFSFASQPAGLRLWIDPVNVTARVNQPTTAQVYAAYDGDRPLTTGLSASLNADPALSVSRLMFTSGPFEGQILLDRITVTPSRAGDYLVGFEPTQILAGVPEKAISTGTMRIRAVP